MLSVRMLREWQYDFVDIHGEIATRTCPKWLVLELDLEIAAAAVAEGAAETMQPHTPEFAERLRVHKRLLDLIAEVGDFDQALQLLTEEESARAADAEKASTKAKPAKGGDKTPATADTDADPATDGDGKPPAGKKSRAAATA